MDDGGAQGKPPGGASGTAVSVALAGGALALAWLHFAEPELRHTWSFAHLGRHPALPWVGAACLVVLPALGHVVWRLPALRRPPARVGLAGAVAALVVLWAVVAVLGLRFPAPVICIDAVYFVKEIREGTSANHRWLLTLWAYGKLFAPVSGWVAATTFVRVLNALATAAALLAMVGCARLLARERREALAIALLACSAFGTLQLAFGYIDVYPVAQAAFALFAWTALRFVEGRGAALWPLAIAAVAPLWYVGLVLLAPAALVVAWLAASRPGGVRNLVPAAVAALVLLALGTLPLAGLPLDLLGFVRGVARDSHGALGLSPSSSLLPWSYMLSGEHVVELLHGLLLTDPVGVLLLVTSLPAVLFHGVARAERVRLVLLLALVAPALAYAFAMDPLFGPYADWDLFSYGAVATGLAGAYAFVLWARGRRAPAGALLGLLLAVAAVHALARLDALDEGFERHMREAPYHVEVTGELRPGHAP